MHGKQLLYTRFLAKLAPFVQSMDSAVIRFLVPSSTFTHERQVHLHSTWGHQERSRYHSAHIHIRGLVARSILPLTRMGMAR